MNPDIVPISRIRVMNNSEIIDFAKQHQYLTILEQELLKHLEAFVREEARRTARTEKFLRSVGESDRRAEVRVRGIVDWAKGRMQA